MKSAALICLFLPLMAAQIARGQQSGEVTGVWLAEDVPNAPWVFDLKQDGAALSGSVWQTGRGAAAPVYEGVVSGNELSFKVDGGTGGTISFKGTRNGDAIAFTRTPSNTAGVGNGLFGAAATNRLTVTRMPQGSTPPAQPGGAPATTDLGSSPPARRGAAAAPIAEAGATATRVVMLGTGTPAADPERFGPSLVVLVGDSPYLFDVGVGVVRRWAAAIQRGVANLPVTALRKAFVTHLHSDHTLGYADLILTSWTLSRPTALPLEVYGPQGLQDMTTHLLAAYAEDIRVRTGEGGDSQGTSPPSVQVHEINPGVVYKDTLVEITAFAVPHGTWKQAFGYRVKTPDKVIVISGDTGPTDVVAEQCAGCDLLFHEGATRTEATADAYFRQFHTTAEQLARVATRAKPKLLVLYHQRRAGPALEAAHATLRSLYAGPWVVANDLDVYP